MPNIRYVCLSDLHLGEEDSLLTDGRDCSRPSPVLRALTECLAELLRHNEPGAPKPTLILAGDVLELALCAAPQVYTSFEQFLRTMMPAKGELFEEIIYLPGNHDHHMWQSAREAQYLRYLDRLEPGEAMQPPWDTTKLVMDYAGRDRLVQDTMTAIARRLLHLRERGFEILTAYPNFGVRIDGRAVVFHHGHFIEPAYHLLSTLACLFFPEQSLPRDVYTLEKENSAWIDFFWSTLGNCGRIGDDVEGIYEASADPERLHKLTDTLAESVAAKYAEPEWAPRFLREWVLKAALQRVAGSLTTGLERRQAAADTVLSKEAAEGLNWYLGELLARQFQQETGSVPESLAFVFGHSHKPFEECRNGVRVLNTGGWTVDAPAAQPLHGAAAVLIGEDLSAVSLRCYNEGLYSMRAEEPVSAGTEHSALYRGVQEMVGAQAEPWKSFGETARREVEHRIAAFGRRLQSKAQAGPLTASAAGGRT